MKRLFVILIILSAFADVYAKRDYSEEKGLIAVSDSSKVEISVMKGDILITPTTRDSIFFYCIKSAGDGLSADDVSVEVDTTGSNIVRISCLWKNPDDDYRGDIEVLLPLRILLSRVFTTSGKINIDGVKGECSVECFEGDINIERFDGSLDIFNMHGNINVADSRMIRKIENVEGDITADLIGESPDSVFIKTAGGKILLKVSGALNACITMETKNGKVTVSEYFSDRTVSENECVKRVTLNAGKSRIEVRNIEGDIELKPLN